MAESLHAQLSRRESQIMDIVYRLGRATASEVQARLPDAPGNSSVRVMLRILEDRGYLKRYRDGRRYVYVPAESKEQARQKALQHLKRTFFDGSAPQIVATLLSADALSREDLEELARLIESAKQEESE